MLKGLRSRILAALIATSASLSMGLWLSSNSVPASASAASQASGSAASASSPRAFTLRPDWPVGTRYVYALDWRSEQRVQPQMPGGQQAGPSEALQGSIRLSADLVLRSLGREGESFLLGAALENVREARLELSGQLALDAATLKEALTGREVLLEVDGAGVLRTLHFDPKDSDLFKHEMQWLLTHAQPTLPANEAQREAGRWEAVEATSLGQARGTYEVDAQSPLTVNRVRDAYTKLFVAQEQRAPLPQKLDSQARFSFSEAGHLSGLNQRERLLVQDGSGAVLVDAAELLQLTLREVSRFTPPADVGLAVRTEARKPGVITASASLEQRLLEQRAAGMTMETLLADLLKHGKGGQLPEMSRWMWRATGLLRLEPARSRELTAVFSRSELGSQARAVVLDLLAGAGHAEAQAVLRELLETPAALADQANYTLYLQRLGMVDEPTPETLEYLASKHASARAGQQEPVRNASAYAMGAAVGRLALDDPRAGDYNRLLLEELSAASTSGERVTYLRSVGNAGRPENVSAVVSHVADPEVPVRAAVAAALRKTDSPESTQALLQLVRASERPVQAEALAALNERYLDAAALASLRDVVVSGSLRQGTETLLAALLSERLEEGPAVFQMLQALERRSTHDPALHARVMEMMVRVSGVAQVP
jgi:HEAT repeat protein